MGLTLLDARHSPLANADSHKEWHICVAGGVASDNKIHGSRLPDRHRLNIPHDVLELPFRQYELAFNLQSLDIGPFAITPKSRATICTQTVTGAFSSGQGIYHGFPVFSHCRSGIYARFIVSTADTRPSGETNKRESERSFSSTAGKFIVNLL